MQSFWRQWDEVGENVQLTSGNPVIGRQIWLDTATGDKRLFLPLAVLADLMFSHNRQPVFLTLNGGEHNAFCVFR